jgi:hypothetical protein
MGAARAGDIAPDSCAPPPTAGGRRRIAVTSPFDWAYWVSLGDAALQRFHGREAAVVGCFLFAEPLWALGDDGKLLWRHTTSEPGLRPRLTASHSAQIQP